MADTRSGGNADFPGRPSPEEQGQIDYETFRACGTSLAEWEEAVPHFRELIIQAMAWKP